MQVHPSGNYIPTVISSPNYTSLPSMVATFLVTYLMAVLQPSRYSVFHGRDTPIQLSLPWQSYFSQCLNTETFTQGNRDFTTETLSISYIMVTIYHKGQMITQWVNLLVGYNVGVSQENSTRSLCWIRVLYIQSTHSLCYILMSASFLTQGHHVVYICSDIIFQILLPCFRPMMSHHVTCHVIAVSHAFFIIQKKKKRKEKENQYKIRKIK